MKDLTTDEIEDLLDEIDTMSRQRGAKPGCDVSAMSFPGDGRKKWKTDPAYRRKLLSSLPPASYVKRVLGGRAGVRSGRFFGEAYVATAKPVQDGWYSSHKWLTSRSWTDASDPTDPLKKEFKKALAEHFPDLATVQDLARAFARGRYPTPVPPDLWLIRRGRHWFLESKILPGDSLSKGQLAGLAVIAMCWPRVQVGVVYLQPEGKKMHPLPSGIHNKFWAYCERLSALKRTKRIRRRRSA